MHVASPAGSLLGSSCFVGHPFLFIGLVKPLSYALLSPFRLRPSAPFCSFPPLILASVVGQIYYVLRSTCCHRDCSIISGTGTGWIWVGSNPPAPCAWNDNVALAMTSSRPLLRLSASSFQKEHFKYPRSSIIDSVRALTGLTFRPTRNIASFLFLAIVVPLRLPRSLGCV